MDYAFPEPLTREDLLRILQDERKITGMAELPYGELLRIYKSFAIPLGKRNDRIRKPNPLYPSKRISSNEMMDIDEIAQPNKQIIYSFDNLDEELICYREKRRIELEEYLEDECLSSATKRIKITWF